MQMIMPYRRYRRPSSLGFPFGPMMPKQVAGFDTASVMKTDIRQTEDAIELSVELPGFAKDDVELELKDGYVIVSAQMKSETEESSEAETEKVECTCETPAQTEKAEETTASTEEQQKSEQPAKTWVRRERFFGSCQRSFYVGEEIDEENISAKFENGLLNISVPKKAQLPEPEQKKLIAIES